MTRPLAGVRIADFTVHAAGPFCTHLLAQLGAECIKIESRQRPDIFRKPHPVYGRTEPSAFDQVSAGKLSIRLNLKHKEGAALARDLVARSDAAVENFRPGVLRRLGLDWEALRVVRPDLVMVSVSSSGQTSPDAAFSGYAPLFGAWGAMGTLSGYADGPPVEMRHVMDHAAGLNGAYALVAGLHRQRRTGEGGYFDVAARDVAGASVGEHLLAAAMGMEAERCGNAHPAMAPHGVYRARGEDRWVAVAVRTDEAWRAFCRVMGQPALAGDRRFATAGARRAHRAEIEGLVAEWMAGQDAEGAAAVLQAAGVAAHVSWNAADIASDRHLRERGAIVDVAVGPQGRAAVGAPFRITGAQIGLDRLTPALGEHEDYVFGTLLGLSRRDRDRLEADGAIA